MVEPSGFTLGSRRRGPWPMCPRMTHPREAGSVVAWGSAERVLVAGRVSVDGGKTFHTFREICPPGKFGIHSSELFDWNGRFIPEQWDEWIDQLGREVRGG